MLRRARVAIVLGMLGVLPGGVLPALADPPARVGRLSAVEGAVAMRAPEEGQWGPALVNYPVTSGESFRTGPDARAEIRIAATSLHLDGATELDLVLLDDRDFAAVLRQGSLNIRVPRLVEGEGYSIETRRGTVVLASPGTFRIVAGDEGAPTRVAALEGAARIVDPRASLSLDPGEEAVISGDGELSFAIGEAQPSPFDDASLARDRQEEAVPAPPYLAPEMTGYEDLMGQGTWSTLAGYGPVWYPPPAPLGWAPYRYGRWMWVAPWGWTWIDDQPWGFAPFHYGRWAFIGGRWCWVPGILVAHPVYAPALVGFLGGAGWGASLALGGPAIGWFPLGPREPYLPSYAASARYLRSVNLGDVTDITAVNRANLHASRVAHANRRFATVVPAADFAGARPVSRAALAVPPAALAVAPFARGVPLRPPTGMLLPGRSAGVTPRPPPQATAPRPPVVYRPAPWPQTVYRPPPPAGRIARQPPLPRVVRPNPPPAERAVPRPAQQSQLRPSPHGWERVPRPPHVAPQRHAPPPHQGGGRPAPAEQLHP